jgi:hypothetical protein
MSQDNRLYIDLFSRPSGLTFEADFAAKAAFWWRFSFASVARKRKTLLFLAASAAQSHAECDTI